MLTALKDSNIYYDLFFAQEEAAEHTAKLYRERGASALIDYLISSGLELQPESEPVDIAEYLEKTPDELEILGDSFLICYNPGLPYIGVYYFDTVETEK